MTFRRWSPIVLTGLACAVAAHAQSTTGGGETELQEITPHVTGAVVGKS